MSSSNSTTQDAALDLIRQFNSPINHAGRFCFDNLPAELRLRIYDRALEDSEGHLVLYRLSLVSKLIRSETFHYLFRERPFYPCTIKDLTNWVHRGIAINPALPGFVEIYNFSALAGSFSRSRASASELELITEDMAAIEKANNGQFMSHVQRYGMDAQAMEMFDAAKENMGPSSSLIGCLSKVLERLPRLKRVKIFSLSSRMITGVDLQRALDAVLSPSQHLLIEVIADRCPQLTDLTIINDLIPLKFLNRLPNLKRFVFNGYSLTAPSEAIELLQGLKKLQHLTINDGPLTRKRSYFDSSYVTYTPEVLSSMRPLKSLTIHNLWSEDLTFLSVPMMLALDTHRTLLTELNIQTAYDTIFNAHVELLRFVGKSELGTLSIDTDFPWGFHVDDVEFCLPGSLERLNVRSSSLNCWVPRPRKSRDPIADFLSSHSEGMNRAVCDEL